MLMANDCHNGVEERLAIMLHTGTTSIYVLCTGSSKKMDGIWNHYNLNSTRRIYTFGVLKCSEKFRVLDLP